MKLNLFTKIAIVFVTVGIITGALSISTMSRSSEETFIKYYVGFQSNYINLTLENFEEFNRENIDIINNYSKNIVLSEYLTTEKSLSSRELYSIFYDIEQSLNNDYNATYQRKVFVRGTNGRIYADDTATIIANSDEIKNGDIYKLSTENPQKLVYSYGTSGFYNENPELVAVKQLSKVYSTQKIGTIFISIEEKTIQSLYENFIEKESNTYIIDTAGNIISSNNLLQVGLQNQEMLEIAENIVKEEIEYHMTYESDTRFMYMSAYIPVFDMYIVNKIDMNVALADFNDASINTQVISGVVIIIGLIAVFLMTRSIYEPLKEIILTISSSTKKGFKKIENIKTVDEVSKLRDAYNFMIDEIEGYTKELVDIERQKRFAELSALQMQINPHFLYNTLAVIKYLVWQGEKDKATKTIEALIDLLQSTISKNEEMISVYQEVENLKNYILINEIRYGDKIRVSLFIDESILDEKVPKLIFQPFIENAYFHAFQIKKSGDIRFIIDKKGENLICDIIDNGDGMENFDQSQAKEHFTGVGIMNVDQRIKLIFGEGYGVHVTSTSGFGTKVRIKLPISEKSHNDEK